MIPYRLHVTFRIIHGIFPKMVRVTAEDTVKRTGQIMCEIVSYHFWESLVSFLRKFRIFPENVHDFILNVFVLLSENQSAQVSLVRNLSKKYASF